MISGVLQLSDLARNRAESEGEKGIFIIWDCVLIQHKLLYTAKSSQDGPLF